MVLCEVERGKLREGGQIHETREAQWRLKLWRRTDDGSHSGGGQIGLIVFWIMNINCKQRFLNSSHGEKQVRLAFATPAFRTHICVGFMYKKLWSLLTKHIQLIDAAKRGRNHLTK
jgi:hypothetical protein